MRDSTVIKLGAGLAVIAGMMFVAGTLLQMVARPNEPLNTAVQLTDP